MFLFGCGFSVKVTWTFLALEPMQKLLELMRLGFKGSV